MSAGEERELGSPAELERFVCDAARAGGAVLRRRFGEEVGVETKGLHDFVTVVDREAEAAIVERIRARFPDHEIMAEEGSPELRAARYRWVIDPLDGTTNFIHGVPVFGVSIALEDDAGLVAGAIHDPLRGETFHARRGGGARLDGRPIRCSALAEPREALVATGFPFRELGRLDRYLVAFESFVRSTAGLRRAGAACIDLAWTACGRYDGFWEVGLSRWDVAAGILLVREAGGVVTDVLGGASALASGDVVAAGPALHPRLIEITSRAFGA
jgi:myo-inositol-1(or 4)-monophosphatase